MTTDNQAGYVNYFAVLGLGEQAKPGEVRRAYKTAMKKLIGEIEKTEITEERREQFLIDMALLNAALYILRDAGSRTAYLDDRNRLIELEQAYRESDPDSDEGDRLRRRFDGALRDFLSKYVEEAMLTAGRDKECVELSGWNPAHERHASPILRRYRQELYQQVLERVPFVGITTPDIDWGERRRLVAEMLAD
jgi:hypothetical protein